MPASLRCYVIACCVLPACKGVAVLSDSSSPPWTVSYLAPLSMGFSRKEYWSGLPSPPPGNLPDPGIKPKFLISPALADGFFTTSTPGKSGVSEIYLPEGRYRGNVPQVSLRVVMRKDIWRGAVTGRQSDWWRPYTLEGIMEQFWGWRRVSD